MSVVMRTLKRIVIHHSASSRITTLAEIDSWHRKRGFARVGYHYVIEDDGAVLVGRPITQQGAHCKADGANRDSIGICVTGDNTNPTEVWNDLQVAALVQLLRDLYSMYGELTIYGHRDIPGAATKCPGLDIYELLKGVKIELA
jgi:N-acetylmuramoyl-L-alanine amidase